MCAALAVENAIVQLSLRCAIGDPAAASRRERAMAEAVPEAISSAAQVLFEVVRRTRNGAEVRKLGAAAWMGP
jgi:hypothetical protein